MKWCAVVGLGCLVSISLSKAEPIWLVNFNGEGEGAAPTELRAAGPDEVSVSGVFHTPEGSEEGRMTLVPSDGPDGGLALRMKGGDERNGAGYISTARGQYLETNAITYEVLLKPSEFPEGFNKEWGGQQILNQQPGGDIPQCWLSMDEGGIVRINSLQAKAEAGLPLARWSHLAGVCVLSPDEGGECNLRIYINGELAQEGSFRRPKGKLPKSLGLGCYLQKGKGDSFQGDIDAIAVSSRALEPSEFVLPIPKS